MYYFIYAYPAKYGGLHGCYDYTMVESDSYNEVCIWAYELAYDTVERYLRADEIYSTDDYMYDEHDGEEWDECYKDDYWDAFNEAMEEQCEYEIYAFKDGVTEADYDRWLKENMPPRDFIKRYCRQLTDEEINT